MELQVDGNNNEMEWSFKQLRPINGYCNWKFRVNGIDEITQKLSDPELSNYIVTITVESKQSNFELVSDIDKEFQFGGSGSADNWTYEKLNLERASLLDIHLIAS